MLALHPKLAWYHKSLRTVISEVDSHPKANPFQMLRTKRTERFKFRNGLALVMEIGFQVEHFPGILVLLLSLRSLNKHWALVGVVPHPPKKSYFG